LDLVFREEHPKRRIGFFIIAVLAAFISSFSSIQGLLTCVTGSLLILLNFRKNLYKSSFFIIWNIVAIISWILYYIDFVKPNLLLAIEHPGWYVEYFLGIMGNVVSGPVQRTLLLCSLGAFILIFVCIISIKIWNNKQIKQFLFPLLLIVNNLLISGSIAIGRVADLGENSPFPSRYTSFGIYVWIGICLIGMELYNKKNNPIIKKLHLALLLVLIVSIPLNTFDGIRKGVESRYRNEYNAYIVETMAVQPDNYVGRVSYFDRDKRMKCRNYLEKYQLNLFHSPQYSIPEVVYNDSIAQVNKEVLHLFERPLRIEYDFLIIVRPVVNVVYEDRITNLYLDVDGQIFPLYYNKKRNNQPVDEYFIWDLSVIETHHFSPGMHQAKIKALTLDGSCYIIENEKLKFEINRNKYETLCYQ
jgi:hypothetical protein